MKKFFILFTAILLSLTGCSSNVDDEEETEETSKIPEATTETCTLKGTYTADNILDAIKTKTSTDVIGSVIYKGQNGNKIIIPSSVEFVEGRSLKITGLSYSDAKQATITWVKESSKLKIFKYQTTDYTTSDFTATSLEIQLQY